MAPVGRFVKTVVEESKLTYFILSLADGFHGNVLQSTTVSKRFSHGFHTVPTFSHVFLEPSIATSRPECVAVACSTSLWSQSCLTRVCSMFRQPGTIQHNARIEHKDGGRTKYCNSAEQQPGPLMKHTSEPSPLPPNTMLSEACRMATPLRTNKILQPQHCIGGKGASVPVGFAAGFGSACLAKPV